MAHLCSVFWYARGLSAHETNPTSDTTPWFCKPDSNKHTNPSKCFNTSFKKTHTSHLPSKCPSPNPFVLVHPPNEKKVHFRGCPRGRLRLQSSRKELGMRIPGGVHFASAIQEHLKCFTLAVLIVGLAGYPGLVTNDALRLTLRGSCSCLVHVETPPRHGLKNLLQVWGGGILCILSVPIDDEVIYS